MPITKQQQRRGFLADLPILDDGEIGLAQDTSQVFIGNLGVNLELAGGEANTASNIGAGVGLFDAKVGSDLQFKTLVAGTNIIIQDGVPANSITISAAGGFVDPLTTRGDILIRNALNVTTRLAIGTNGQVLTSNGTDVSWAAAAGVSGAFATAANITSNSPGTLATDDFVFGSNSLDGIETRFFFDKSNGAFRAGPVATAVWDDINRGAGSTAFGSETTASGPRSMAWGIQTQATNQNATAFGVNTFALGPSSTAWGWNNTTAGALLALGSTAFGQGTQATNRNSTSWGLVSQATGQEATSWGTQTTASGQNATAWGTNTTASGLGATVWGSAPALATVLASGDYSTAFGTQTTASGPTSTVWGDNTNSIGINTTAWGSFAQAGESEFVSAAASIAGTILTDLTASFITFNTPLIFGGAFIEVNGESAIVLSVDSNTQLTLDRVLTAGAGLAWNIIRGNNSTAWGNDTVAAGFSATSFGYETYASGSQSTAFGYYARATGENATAWGYSSDPFGGPPQIVTASGSAATAWGQDSTADGDRSTAFGTRSTAIGEDSLAFGTGSRAEGDASAAWGVDCQAINNGSVAFGDTAIVDSMGTLGGVAFGTNVTVNADYGVAIGSEVTVTGEDSFAIGLDLAGPAVHVLADENTLGVFGGSLLFAGPTVTENVISFNDDVTIPAGRTYTHHYMDILAGRLVTIQASATLLTRAPTINGTLTIDANGLWDVI